MHEKYAPQLEGERFLHNFRKFVSERIYFDFNQGYSQNLELQRIVNSLPIDLSAQKQNRYSIKYRGYQVDFSFFVNEFEQVKVNYDILISNLNKIQKFIFKKDFQYGEFLAIDHFTKTNWDHGLRFDLNLNNLFHDLKGANGNDSVIKGTDLEDLIKKLINLATNLDIGLDIKPVLYTVDVFAKRDLKTRENMEMCFKRIVHLYPRFEPDLSQQMLDSNLCRFYNEAQKIWFDKIALNESDINFGKLEKYPRLLQSTS